MNRGVFDDTSLRSSARTDVLRRHVEHSIAITTNGPEILTRV